MKKIQLMGILNVTPDSFSDGGLYFNNKEKIIARVKEMIEHGADIIDIGGESTRPGSHGISPDEELARVISVIDDIREKISKTIPLSIDTNKAVVAENALIHGVNIVNSLGGMLFDQSMGDVIKKFRCTFIVYHIKGIPRIMQKGEIKYTDVMNDIKTFFHDQITQGVARGIKRNQFILDPGIGFGKTVSYNIEIIQRLSELKTLQLPILVGISRKSHLGKLLQQKLHLDSPPSSEDRLEASLAETAVAIQNGATIIRTHDVLPTKKFVTILEEFI